MAEKAVTVLRVTDGSLDVGGRLYPSLSDAPDARPARKIAVPHALQMTEAFRLVDQDGNEHIGESGDWVVEAVPGDVYVVRAARFSQIYELI